MAPSKPTPTDATKSAPGRPPAYRVASALFTKAARDGMAVGAITAAGPSRVAYQARRDIARDLAENWLARQGVESHIRIDRLDSNGFSGRIRLGPANDPDLV